jgi:hypothetical protein
MAAWPVKPVAMRSIVPEVAAPDLGAAVHEYFRPLPPAAARCGDHAPLASGKRRARPAQSRPAGLSRNLDQ